MATSPSERAAGAIEELYDDEPVRALPPDEALTPMWLPIVGAALLMVGALGWALMGADEESGRSAASASSAKPVASPAAPPAATPRRPAPRPAAKPTAPGRRRPGAKEMDHVTKELNRFRSGQRK